MFFFVCVFFPRLIGFLGIRLEHWFPAWAFFFSVEISWRTLIPLCRPESVHSGSASWDDCGRQLPDELFVSSFSDRFPHVGSRMYACLGVTGYLHFWQNDGFFVVVFFVCVCHCGNTRVERTPNKSQHTKLTLEEKIIPPLLPGFELATFRLWVRRSYQQIIPVSELYRAKKKPPPPNNRRHLTELYTATFLENRLHLTELYTAAFLENRLHLTELYTATFLENRLHLTELYTAAFLENRPHLTELYTAVFLENRLHEQCRISSYIYPLKTDEPNSCIRRTRLLGFSWTNRNKTPCWYCDGYCLLPISGRGDQNRNEPTPGSHQERPMRSKWRCLCPVRREGAQVLCKGESAIAAVLDESYHMEMPLTCAPVTLCLLLFHYWFHRADSLEANILDM